MAPLPHSLAHRSQPSGLDATISLSTGTWAYEYVTLGPAVSRHPPSERHRAICPQYEALGASARPGGMGFGLILA